MASPAAVLSILVNANTAQATAALGKTQGALVATEKQTGKTRASMAKFGKVAAVGIAGGAVAAGVALKGFVNAAMDSEKSNARMRAQLKASGIEFGKHKDQINKVIESQSKLSALDDEDLQDSFTNLVRVTGDVNKALRLNGLAADFARAKGMDVAKAGELVGKVAGGNVGILGRYGIKVKEGATAQEALAMMQQKFAGQAKAYGETAAGAQDRFKVAVENLQEALGSRLLPIVGKVMNGVANFVNSLTAGSGAAGGFGKVVGSVFETVKGAVGTAVQFLRQQFNEHRDDLANVGAAMRNIGVAVREVWEHVVLPIIRRVLPAIVQIIRGAFNVIGGIIKTLSSLIKGDFGAAWDGVKQIFRGALQVVFGILRAATAPFREAIDKAFEGIKNGARALWEWVKDAGGTLIDKFVNGIKSAPGKLVDAAKWLKDKIVGAIKGFLGIDSPSKVFQEIGGHMISGLIKGMNPGEVIKFVKSSFGGITSLANKLFGGVVGGGAGIGGKVSGTLKMAQTIANKFGLGWPPSSGYRSPEHNAAVGGVPNSLHTHGSPSNPGAIDLVGPVANMNAALIWARQNLNLAESMVHDVGSGLHLHLGFFKKGGLARGWGVVGEAGPEIVNFGPSAARVYSNADSRAMLSGGGMTDRLLARIADLLDSGADVPQAMVDRGVYRMVSREFSTGWQGRSATPSNAARGVAY